mgnify:CR=1 FL=1
MNKQTSKKTLWIFIQIECNFLFRFIQIQTHFLKFDAAKLLPFSIICAACYVVIVVFSVQAAAAAIHSKCYLLQVMIIICGTRLAIAVIRSHCKTIITLHI